MTEKSYSNEFFEYIDRRAIRSANLAVPILLQELKPSSVLDVGCGRGSWLQAWKSGGVEIVGVDGSYVDQRTLLIAPSEFIAHDLSKPFSLNRRFDLAISLETAEHLPPARGESFVLDLCSHADMVIFSAAQPGQGGEHHVNERPLRYWIAHFANLGFDAYDIRKLLLNFPQIDPWYRYNAILYVRPSVADHLSPRVKSLHVKADVDLDQDMSGRWKARLLLGRLLPMPVATLIAQGLSRWNAYARRTWH